MKVPETVVNTPGTGVYLAKALMMTWLLAAFFAGGTLMACAQTGADDKNSPPPSPKTEAPSSEPTPGPVDLKSLPRNLFLDQKNFWTTPFHMTQQEWKWVVPLIFVGAGLLASDTAAEKHAPTSATTISHATTASNAGLAAVAGVGAGMFLLGKAGHDDQLRETGLLSGEAGIDALLDTEVFKYATGRDRPFVGDGRGRFFQGGDSFPSAHAEVSWAIASVIAHEYPGPMTKLLAYGLAGGVSAARFAGQKHFASDVLVGSALGWYTGRQVFRSHSHYSAADIAKYGTFSKGEETDNVREPEDMGSPYVPVDSWVYPAMERLIALGYIQSADLGMRPWTRMECARLLGEANQRLQDDSSREGSDPQKIYAALASEFSDETARSGGGANLGLNLDSAYTRFAGISGTPLQDGFHFGQTIINDYGRPYAEGLNNVTGLTARAVAGPFSFYVRGEYQHAPSVPALSLEARQAIQMVDNLNLPPGLPVPPSIPTPAVNKIDWLEGYVGVQLDNWQITFGKQALWWGADAGGPMLFSTNAAPILMFRINRVKPLKLPSVFGALGNIRVESILGRISGYHWVYSAISGFTGSWTQTLSDQPFIMGEKISFKPSTNLELGISATVLVGGTGVPFTLRKALHAFSPGNGLPGTPSDPGDRRGGFDFAYRIPKLRDSLTFYADAFTDDESNPWFAWDKTALTSGLYLSRVPRIPKLDFRVEGVYTDLPGGTAVINKGFFYNNGRFKSGYTNDGNLIGSWIGRQGQGAEAWTNYWFSPKNKLQFNFRHQKVSREFIPSGGTLTDFGVRADFWAHSNLALSSWVQYERWLFPVIQPNASRNVTAALQVQIDLHKLFRHSSTNAPGSQP